MYIKCWGTRGSLPVASDHNSTRKRLTDLIDIAESTGITTTEGLRRAIIDEELPKPFSFGGNTTCTEVGMGDDLAFVDMGSGLREAGSASLAAGRKEIHIFVTHMHWDHVMGLPFFVPIHLDDCTIHIYHVHRNGPEHIKINFNGVNFPVTWEKLAAEVRFHQLKLYQPVEIGTMRVTPFALDHPGGSFGYRFDGSGKSAAIGIDGEYKRLTPRELGPDLKYFQNLDFLLFDAQYELAELAHRFDWGHCSPNIGVDLALWEHIKRLAFAHHDPWASDTKLRRMLTAAEGYRAAQFSQYQETWQNTNSYGPDLIMAYDGLQIDL